MLDLNNKDRIMLPDGRMMKNGGRAEAVRTLFEERVSILPYHWKSNRIIRRDFNSLMLLMLKKRKEPKLRKTLDRMLKDIEHESHYLTDSTLTIETPPRGDFCDLPLRLVSPDAKRLLEALMAYDKALAKLTKKEGQEAAENHCADFALQYSRLKHWLFGK